MMQPRSILSLAFCLAAALPAGAAPGRYAITTERIAAAVTSSGVTVSADQVMLLANVVASIAEPQLKVKSIDRSDDRRAVARLECASPNQCLPFMVALRIAADSAGNSSDARAQSLSSARSSAPLVRAGSPATLLLEGPHVHISLSVVCLENGILGQTIRVASRDRRQFYTVHVVREGVLEGSL